MQRCPLYTFDQWKNGEEIPPGWKCHYATMRHGWTPEQIDALLLTYLPGNVATDTAKWESKDMRDTGWRVLPYGFNVKRDGSAVIFDREYRWICEIGSDGVQVVDPMREDQRAGFRVFLYDDGAKPRYCPETRRLQRVIVDRLGLGAELKRRAILQRNGKLPISGGSMPQNELDMSTPWAKELEAVVLKTSVFAFDGRAGRVMRMRRPLTGADDWTPGPVSRDDIKGIRLWLRSRGHHVSVKMIAAVVDVLGANLPRQMQIAAQ